MTPALPWLRCARDDEPIRNATFGLAALLLAFTVKRHYSTALACELDWILRPTAALVSLLTRTAFDAQPGSGYVSGELATVITPACAGVNYLIIAFATLVFGFLTRVRGTIKKGVWITTSALAAYLATILVNALRITFGIALHELAPDGLWISPEQLHRIAGVVVYLGSLWLLFCAAERALTRSVAA
jgi:exosortase K